jgi:hypothetical protein
VLELLPADKVQHIVSGCSAGIATGNAPQGWRTNVVERPVAGMMERSES